MPEYQSSTEHPLSKEKPEDVLTKEELAQRGIEIIQTEEVKLHIRPGAFKKGALLEAFTPSGKRNLIIALVDTSRLKLEDFEDPVYNKILPLLAAYSAADNLQAKKEKRGAISEIKRSIRETREKLQEAKKQERKASNIIS